MDPEEIARRERERAEKKKRKQERKLMKAQNKLLAGDSFHTPGGSESDSGVSQFTDSEQQPSALSGSIHIELPPTRGAGHPTDSGCDQTRHDFGQHPNQRTTGEPEQVSPGSTSPGGPRSSALQKRNPFSVESLLSDNVPRRKPSLDFSSLPNQRTLVGKGHFLLYPITHQPLGFLVPQTALKAPPGQESRLTGQRSGERSPTPSDLSGFGSDCLNLNHPEQHRNNHMSRAEGSDVEDGGGDSPTASTTPGSEASGERPQKVQAEAGDEQRATAKDAGERASPDVSECLRANADGREMPGGDEGDGGDVDMD